MNIFQQTKKLCKLYNIRPARSMGQNFLIKESVYRKVIDSADLNKDDIVLEVGSGLGFLTEMLARRVKRVIAVELDDKLAEALRQRLDEQGIRNAEVVNDNIFNIEYSMLNIAQRAKKSYKIVANIPYNITSRFLRKFLEEVENKPEMLAFMAQEEVADRITAKPGKMSLLAVSAQFYSDAKIIMSVPKECFWPKPRVDSKIIKLNLIHNTLNVNEKKFFKLVKMGFSSKRKQLRNNLAKGLSVKNEIIISVLREIGLNEKARAQELSVEDWGKLYVVLEGQKMV